MEFLLCKTHEKLRAHLDVRETERSPHKFEERGMN